MKVVDVLSNKKKVPTRLFPPMFLKGSQGTMSGVRLSLSG